MTTKEFEQTAKHYTGKKGNCTLSAKMYNSKKLEKMRYANIEMANVAAIMWVCK